MILAAPRPPDPSLAVPVHLLMTVAMARRFPQVCAAACLSTPAAQRRTSAAFRLLGALRYDMLRALGGDAQPKLSPQSECAVALTWVLGVQAYGGVQMQWAGAVARLLCTITGDLMYACLKARIALPTPSPLSPAPSSPRRSYLDLTLGCLLPALIQAAAETRLYRQHCTERRRAGLPRERGWQARVHDELAELAHALDWPQAVVLLWVCLGIAFDLSLLAGRVNGP